MPAGSTPVAVADRGHKAAAVGRHLHRAAAGMRRRAEVRSHLAEDNLPTRGCSLAVAAGILPAAAGILPAAGSHLVEDKHPVVVEGTDFGAGSHLDCTVVVVEEEEVVVVVSFGLEQYR